MRKRGWGRVAPLLVVAMAVVGVAACSGDDPKPGAGPVGSPSKSSAAATPTPTPTPLPSLAEAARKPTPEGAQEFVRYLLRIWAYAHSTNDWTPLSDVSVPGCVFCRQVIDGVKQRNSRGEHVEGVRFSPIDVIADPSGSKQRTIVDVTYSDAKSELVGADGKVVTSFRGAEFNSMLVALRWDDLRGWRVIEANIKPGKQ